MASRRRDFLFRRRRKCSLREHSQATRRCAMPAAYFLYARKSTEEEDRQVLSIDSQLHELRTYAQREGLRTVEEFVEAKTAKQPGRPVFDLMLKHIEDGKATGR